MNFELESLKFDQGVYHLIPALSIIWNNKAKALTVEAAFLSWDVSVSVAKEKKSASKKGKVK